MQRNYGDYDHDYVYYMYYIDINSCLLYCSVCMPCMFTYF